MLDQNTMMSLFLHPKSNIIKVPCFVNVIYYRPQSLLLQQFGWETLDEPPRYPRIIKFFNYWHHNIHAVIQEATITERNNSKIINVDRLIKLS